MSLPKGMAFNQIKGQRVFDDDKRFIITLRYGLKTRVIKIEKSLDLDVDVKGDELPSSARFKSIVDFNISDLAQVT